MLSARAYEFEIRRADNGFIVTIGGKLVVCHDLNGLLEAFFQSLDQETIHIEVTGISGAKKGAK